MNIISNREIRVFVAGAMAVNGFQSLTWLPSDLAYFFADPSYGVALKLTTLISSSIPILSLPLGVGIFFEKGWSVRWTKLYLMAWLALGFLTFLGMWTLPMKKSWDTVAMIASDLITSLVLLWLLSAARFQEKGDGQGSLTSSNSYPPSV